MNPKLNILLKHIRSFWAELCQFLNPTANLPCVRPTTVYGPPFIGWDRFETVSIKKYWRNLAHEVPKEAIAGISQPTHKIMLHTIMADGDMSAHTYQLMKTILLKTHPSLLVNWWSKTARHAHPQKSVQLIRCLSKFMIVSSSIKHILAMSLSQCKIKHLSNSTTQAGLGTHLHIDNHLEEERPSNHHM